MAETPITYADARSDLPQSDFAKRLAELRIARVFEAANSNVRDDTPKPPPQKDRSMVAQAHPHPVLKPSPHLAAETDARSFNARWDAERDRAAPKHPTSTQGDRPMSDDTPNRPAETLREGALKAAIWRNVSERGAYHSVTLARTYKDQDGNLHDTSSFRAQDMLGLSELARRAHHHTHDLDRETFKDQRRAQAAPDQTRDSSRDR